MWDSVVSEITERKFACCKDKDKDKDKDEQEWRQGW